MTDLSSKLTELGIEPMDGETFVPYSDVQIAEVEGKVNAQLPDDYKRVLATFGRSRFSKWVNCTPDTKPLYFGWFFGFSELMNAIGYCQDDLPETIIPIGEDGCGNLFCLGVAGKDAGKVYFSHHCIGWRADADRLLKEGKPVPADIRYQTVYQFASSFRQFIENMVNVD